MLRAVIDRQEIGAGLAWIGYELLWIGEYPFSSWLRSQIRSSDLTVGC